MNKLITIISTILMASMAYCSYFPQIQQNVQADSGNSSVANINAGAGFDGVSHTTLGVAGIQVSLKADKNLTVYIAQSPDGSNWDLIDTYSYKENGNFGITVQAISSYVRISVSNFTTTATTYLRLQTALCPIVEALPRSLDADGFLQIAIKRNQDQYGYKAEYTPMGEQRVVEPYRLVGASFGSSIDTNYWQVASNRLGMVIFNNGTVILDSLTDNGNSAILYTTRRAKYLTGAANRYRCVNYLNNVSDNNIRRWGICNPVPIYTDASYFFCSNGVFGIATMDDGIEVAVTNGNFNGDYGTTVNLSTLCAKGNAYEIYYTASKIKFVISDIVLHNVNATTTPSMSTRSLFGFSSTTNFGAVTVNTTNNPWNSSIYRLGRDSSAPAWKRITGGQTVVLKREAGQLKKVIVNSSNNSSGYTLYDSTGTAVNTIAVSALSANIGINSAEYDVEFYNGLTIVTTGTLDLTIVYE